MPVWVFTLWHANDCLVCNWAGAFAYVYVKLCTAALCGLLLS